MEELQVFLHNIQFSHDQEYLLGYEYVEQEHGHDHGHEQEQEHDHGHEQEQEHDHDREQEQEQEVELARIKQDLPIINF